jgi:hypothetical protein
VYLHMATSPEDTHATRLPNSGDYRRGATGMKEAKQYIIPPTAALWDDGGNRIGEAYVLATDYNDLRADFGNLLGALRHIVNHAMTQGCDRCTDAYQIGYTALGKLR